MLSIRCSGFNIVSKRKTLNFLRNFEVIYYLTFKEQKPSVAGPEEFDLHMIKKILATGIFKIF